jgi:hypothetical protein
MQRQPRFRPVQMLDEWPLGRTPRVLGPAQRDNVRALFGGDDADANAPAPPPPPMPLSADGIALSRRDPNRQSDPVVAETQHPWSRCGIKRVEPAHHADHATGKRVGPRPPSASVAPWDSAASLDARCRLGSARAPSRQPSVDSSGGGAAASSAAPSSTARDRAHAQAQGADWFTLTTQSPFDCDAAPCDVGPPVGAPHMPRHAPRLDSGRALCARVRVLASATGRCCGELWHACVEGNILRRPFTAAPASAAAAAASANRLRRTVPFAELAAQLENALGSGVSDVALADVLALGDCAAATPVRYEHFVRLFNT